VRVRLALEVVGRVHETPCPHLGPRQAFERSIFLLSFVDGFQHVPEQMRVHRLGQRKGRVWLRVLDNLEALTFGYIAQTHQPMGDRVEAGQ
jgi:hypothetical protein